MTNSQAVDDSKKNQAVGIYLAVLGAAGGVLIALAVMHTLGGWAYGLGGFLVLAGVGGLVGMKMGGGFASAPCPGCGAALKFQHPKIARIMACEACGAWAEGAETMRAVPDDRVADYPAFTVDMPAEGVRWPGNGVPACPLCDRPATQTKRVEGKSTGAVLAGAMLGGSVGKVHSIEAPTCGQHDDGVALLVGAEGLQLGFRSRAYHLRFLQLNS